MISPPRTTRSTSSGVIIRSVASPPPATCRVRPPFPLPPPRRETLTLKQKVARDPIPSALRLLDTSRPMRDVSNMRITLTLDDDVLAAARALAAQRGVPIGTVVSDLARRGLAPAQPP